LSGADVVTAIDLGLKDVYEEGHTRVLLTESLPVNKKSYVKAALVSSRSVSGKVYSEFYMVRTQKKSLSRDI